MERVHSLIYWSRAVRPFSAAELERLTAAARQSNARMGVTGMLLYNDGCFLQMLEGRLRDLQAAFRRIEADTRHHSLRVLRASVGPRQFPGCAMGFGKLTVADTGVPALRDTPFNLDCFSENPTLAETVLRDFSGHAPV